MYLTGAPHPRKSDAQALLERLTFAGERLVTDAEVLQEILHRYAAINKRDAIGPTVQLVLDVADEVFPVQKSDVLRASEIVQNPALLSAREAIHISIMERRGVRKILSFDADFDRWPGLERIHTL
jgi:uncharacterized protein